MGRLYRNISRDDLIRDIIDYYSVEDCINIGILGCSVGRQYALIKMFEYHCFKEFGVPHVVKLL